MSGRKRQKTGMINNENENNSMTQETQIPQQTVDAQQVVIPQESERIQRAEWIHEQVKLQREAEDEAWEKIMEAKYELKEKKRQLKSERVELKNELKKSRLMDKVRSFTPKEQNSDSTSPAENVDNNIIDNNIIDIERKIN